MSVADFHPRQLCIAGFSNSGKTTLLEKLFQSFSSQGFRVGYAKHDVHHLNLDKEGKDTDLIWRAGAESIYAHNQDNQFLRSRKESPFQQQLFRDCDFCLIEGHKQSPFPKIIVLDSEETVWEQLNEKAKSTTIAIIGPHASPKLSTHLPYYQRDDIESISNYIKNYFLELSKKIELLGVVMSGGHSKRMGQDKNFLTYQSKPQLQVAHELLQRHCRKVIVSCRAEQSESINLPHLNDEFLNLGPLGGLLTVFAHHPHSALLVTACDLPLLNHSALQELISQRNPFCHASVFNNPESQTLEPLCAIYEPSIRPLLFEALSKGIRSPKYILEHTRIQTIQATDCDALKNANTIEEFKTLQSHFTQSS